MPKGNGKAIPRVKIAKYKDSDSESIIKSLKDRFEQNMQRHPDLKWEKIEKKLKKSPQKLASLFAMESTGGEPDVISYNSKNDEYTFIDCSPQSPERRKICYDRDAEKEREKKGLFPGGNSIDLAKEMGIEILDETQYKKLQELGEFDTKTSSWIKTPENIRKLGGALFMDRRYNKVFTYHNGAKSFYSDRGFRGLLKV